jgi:hypothetical protein
MKWTHGKPRREGYYFFKLRDSAISSESWEPHREICWVQDTNEGSKALWLNSLVDERDCMVTEFVTEMPGFWSVRLRPPPQSQFKRRDALPSGYRWYWYVEDKALWCPEVVEIYQPERDLDTAIALWPGKRREEEDGVWWEPAFMTLLDDLPQRYWAGPILPPKDGDPSPVSAGPERGIA